MSRYLIIIATFATTLSAQSITRVDYRVLPGNLIEITYTLRDSEPEAKYNISLAASLDGGYSFPLSPTSVTGDVGSVDGPGIKSILWKVLDDLPALKSESLVFRVSGKSRNTVVGFFKSMVAGNRLTKRMSNGVTFYAGKNLSSTYISKGFRDAIMARHLNLSQDGRVGLKVINIPFIYKFEAQARVWDVNYPPETQERLRLLSYGSEFYEGDALSFYQFSIGGSISYTPLPVFGLLLPHIGMGGMIWQHILGKDPGSQI